VLVRTLLQDGGPSAVGQHPAEKFSVERYAPAFFERSSDLEEPWPEETTRELARTGHRPPVLSGADAEVAAFEGHDSARADPVEAGHFAGRQAQLALHHAGEPGSE